ncbi:MAG: polysaccharide pyruvyl transferase family protein [Leptolyngbya sp. SIO1D8]|nr:polysaccharide pyruvyl transferase family protein [Leptolyngbya sp. SIO1D8]
MKIKPIIRNKILEYKHFAQRPLWNTIWADHVKFLWYDTKNWGDALNPILIEKISGIHARGFDIALRNSQTIHEDHDAELYYLVIGSTLKHADAQTSIWGAGFASEFSQFRQKPKSIHAVRGPLSRKRINSLGVDCPAIYGDPALLYPRFYHPGLNPKYKLGIIPHYLDYRSPILKKFRNDSNVLILDIKAGIEKFVQNLCSCQHLVSSSLHGLIMADAYGIPSKWIRLSDRLPGTGLKFQDYYASIGCLDVDSFQFHEDVSTQQLYDLCKIHKITLNLDDLLSACPFRDCKLKA